MAFCYINMSTEHPFRLFISGVAFYPATVINPHPVAAPVTHTVFAGVVRRFTTDMFIQSFGGAVNIVWVNKLIPGIQSGGLQLAERITQNVCPAFVKPVFTRLNIPFPGTGPGGINNAT